MFKPLVYDEIEMSRIIEDLRLGNVPPEGLKTPIVDALRERILKGFDATDQLEKRVNDGLPYFGLIKNNGDPARAEDAPLPPANELFDRYLKKLSIGQLSTILSCEQPEVYIKPVTSFARQIEALNSNPFISDKECLHDVFVDYFFERGDSNAPITDWNVFIADGAPKVGFYPNDQGYFTLQVRVMNRINSKKKGEIGMDRFTQLSLMMESIRESRWYAKNKRIDEEEYEGGSMTILDGEVAGVTSLDFPVPLAFLSVEPRVCFSRSDNRLVYDSARFRSVVVCKDTILN
jgi:hypothetical protein